MRDRADEFVHSLRRHAPQQFEELVREIEHGNKGRARQLLRGMSGFIEEGYHEAVIRYINQEVLDSSASIKEALGNNPDALRILLRSGHRSEAIEFYHDRTGEDWQASLAFIKSLEKNLEAEAAAAQELHLAGADSAVLFFLVKSGHLEDAAQYVVLKTGDAAETVWPMVRAMQRDIELGNVLLPEPVRRSPDPETLRFLLRAGHHLVALRYYRDCTEVSVVEAKKAIARILET